MDKIVRIKVLVYWMYGIKKFCEVIVWCVYYSVDYNRKIK